VLSGANLALALAGNSILSIDGSFLFIFIAIIGLIFILNRTLFRPLTSVLDERTRLGEGRIAEARRMLAEVDERLQRYEAQIRAVRSEAYRELEGKRRSALAARQEALAAVRTETSSQIAAARAEIASQTEQARDVLERDARAMAAAISTQILRRPITLPEESSR
jgi:F-type H+-transporting ATPase subunit b